MVFFNPQLEVSLIAIVLTLVSQAVQITFGNKKEMLRHQGEMKKRQDKMKELAKSKHPDAKKQIEEAEKEMLESMNVVMKSSMKLMVASFVIFVPAFFFLSQIYEGLVFGLPIPIPWVAPEPGFDFFNPFTWFSLYSQTNFIGWYALNALIFSLLIVNPIMKFLEKRKGEGNAKTV